MDFLKLSVNATKNEGKKFNHTLIIHNINHTLSTISEMFNNSSGRIGFGSGRIPCPQFMRPSKGS